jgi:drug/metabolite transporter (DMT)-like permease
VNALPLGLGLALASAALYALGVTFQALEARTSPAEESFYLALLRRLLRRPRWILGTAFVVGG